MKKIIIMFMAISMLLVSCSTPNTPSYDDVIPTSTESGSDNGNNDGNTSTPSNPSGENPNTPTNGGTTPSNPTTPTSTTPTNGGSTNGTESGSDNGNNDGNTSTPSTQYTVTFDSNGGSSVTSQTISPNGHATRPANPTKEGYAFDYWYNTDESSEYNFTTATINSNIILHAKWRCVSFELGNSETNDFTYKVKYGTSHWDNVQFTTPTMTAGSYKLHVSVNENKIIFEYYKYNNTIANLKVHNVSVNGNVVTIELVNNN